MYVFSTGSRGEEIRRIKILKWEFYSIAAEEIMVYVDQYDVEDHNILNGRYLPIFPDQFIIQLRASVLALNVWIFLWNNLFRERQLNKNWNGIKF